MLGPSGRNSSYDAGPKVIDSSIDEILIVVNNGCDGPGAVRAAVALDGGNFVAPRRRGLAGGGAGRRPVPTLDSVWTLAVSHTSGIILCVVYVAVDATLPPTAWAPHWANGRETLVFRPTISVESHSVWLLLFKYRQPLDTSMGTVRSAPTHEDTYSVLHCTQRRRVRTNTLIIMLRAFDVTSLCLLIACHEYQDTLPGLR